MVIEMKKSHFIAMILGTIGGILFALGACMTMIPEWNAFQQGIIMGVAGLVVLLVMVLVWRKMENKQPVKLSGKTIAAVLMGIAKVRCRYVHDNGLEQYDRWYRYYYYWNRSPALPYSIYKRIEIMCGYVLHFFKQFFNNFIT